MAIETTAEGFFEKPGRTLGITKKVAEAAGKVRAGALGIARSDKQVLDRLQGLSDALNSLKEKTEGLSDETSGSIERLYEIGKAVSETGKFSKSVSELTDEFHMVAKELSEKEEAIEDPLVRSYLKESSRKSYW